MTLVVSDFGCTEEEWGLTHPLSKIPKIKVMIKSGCIELLLTTRALCRLGISIPSADNRC